MDLGFPKGYAKSGRNSNILIYGRGEDQLLTVGDLSQMIFTVGERGGIDQKSFRGTNKLCE